MSEEKNDTEGCILCDINNVLKIPASKTQNISAFNFVKQLPSELLDKVVRALKIQENNGGTNPIYIRGLSEQARWQQQGGNSPTALKAEIEEVIRKTLQL